MVTVCLSRAAEFKLQTQLVRLMDGTLTSRHVGDFRTGLVRLAALNTGGGAQMMMAVFGRMCARSRLLWSGGATRRGDLMRGGGCARSRTPHPVLVPSGT
eukprot:COSAG01_NODE_17159_length_1170_cov_3.748603_2_plen_99_part_01